MPRLAVAPDYGLLVQVLREPARLTAFSAEQWSRLLDVSEHARLLGWVLQRAPHNAPGPGAPGWLNDRFLVARRAAAEWDRAAWWELNRLHSAFVTSGIQWVVLKGVGYLAAGLPPGHGRRVADVDILVADSDLGKAERVLHEHGWDFPTLDPYNERFYRDWMHELPPMVHRERSTIVDLHHAILPRTSRLHPSTDRLLNRAIEVAPGVRVLCPSHMILHAAAHLFHDGEVAGAIRDLVDLDTLLRCFSRNDDFWRDLTTEAVELQLARPLFYSLRYSRRLLDTPIPADAQAITANWGPPRPILAAMDLLVERTLKGRDAIATEASALALYIRSHWLRMPPVLLMRHLFHKAFLSP